MLDIDIGLDIFRAKIEAVCSSHALVGSIAYECMHGMYS